jgi:hypothetical protein
MTLSTIVAIILTFIISLLIIRDIIICLLASSCSIIQLINTLSILQIISNWHSINSCISIQIILLVAMSFIYTLHIAIAYAQSTAIECTNRLLDAIDRAFRSIYATSFGALLIGTILCIFSHTVLYRQVGIFMLVQTSIAFIHVTCFFSSILAAIGMKL